MFVLTRGHTCEFEFTNVCTKLQQSPRCLCACVMRVCIQLLDVLLDVPSCDMSCAYVQYVYTSVYLKMVHTSVGIAKCETKDLHRLTSMSFLSSLGALIQYTSRSKIPHPSSSDVTTVSGLHFTMHSFHSLWCCHVTIPYGSMVSIGTNLNMHLNMRSGILRKGLTAQWQRIEVDSIQR